MIVLISQSLSPEVLSTLRSLGQELRQGREGQQLELAALAARLNMGVEQLKALEEGDASRLPEPVFVVAQARRVASSLAINIDGALQTLRDSGQFQAKPIKVAELAPSAPSRPPNSAASATVPGIGRLALAAAILAGLTAVSTAGWQRWQRSQARPSQQPGQSMPLTSVQKTDSGSLAPNQLQLNISEPSWLEVKTKTGSILFRGTFKGERRFPLGQGLEVLAGRPDLVWAKLGEGAAQPLGRIDQVRWRSFTAPAP
jgi:cytoskeletal protein RodZ